MAETDLTNIRKYLHQHPEESGKEFNTHKFVKETLQAFAPDEIIEFSPTGLMAVYHGNEPGKKVMFRCEMDALPIKEVGDLAHKSENEGVAHLCGHDGHMAIVLGLAKHFHQHKPSKGKVLLLFQPAEENGMGARQILEDPDFSLYEPDTVLALHNIPGYPEHSIILKKKSFTPSVKSVIVRLLGRTSHAAEPENGINPAMAVSDLIRQFDMLTVNDVHELNFQLLTPIHITMGDPAYGTSAGFAEVHYTLRTWTEKNMRKLVEMIEEISNKVADKYGLQLGLEYLQEFSANKNHGNIVDLVQKVAERNNIAVHWRDVPFKWGEDFGFFTQKHEGAMFGIGSGEGQPALHNPDYDFPDEITPTAIKVFSQVFEDIQSEAK